MNSATKQTLILMEKDAPQTLFMITKCQERASLSEWGKNPSILVTLVREMLLLLMHLFEISKCCPVRTKTDLKSIADFSGTGKKKGKKDKKKLHPPALTQGYKCECLGLASKAMLQQLGCRVF